MRRAAVLLLGALVLVPGALAATPAPVRAALLARLAAREPMLLIGTHALLSERVRLPALRLAIATIAPARPSSTDIARPSPVPPPVTRIYLPANRSERNMMIMILACCRDPATN